MKSRLARNICEILLKETNEVLGRSQMPINTAKFRTSLGYRVSRYLEMLMKSYLPLTDYRVICNESNNPPDIVENGDFRLEVHWKEGRSDNCFGIGIGKDGILYRPEFDDDGPCESDRKEKDNKAKGILF